MSEQFGTLSPRPVHPASPVLLTKNGPRRARIQGGRATKPRPPIVPIESLRVGQSAGHSGTSHHSLDRIQLRQSSSYPEGNFGRNQLLDGSSSLSPLSPNQTNDLPLTPSIPGESTRPALRRPFQTSSPLAGCLTAGTDYTLEGAQDGLRLLPLPSSL